MDKMEYDPDALPEILPSLRVPGFEQPTLGQRTAEAVAKVVGSWTFIIVQTIIIFGWATLNVVQLSWLGHWDSYPFILLNLFMSLQAAYTAPLIMMAQNRESGKDRYVSKSSYFVTARTDFDVRELKSLVAQQSALIELLLKGKKMDTD